METSSYECCYLAKALCSGRLHAKEVVQIILQQYGDERRGSRQAAAST
jgi:hypothetical protein